MVQVFGSVVSSTIHCTVRLPGFTIGGGGGGGGMGVGAGATSALPSKVHAEEATANARPAPISMPVHCPVFIAMEFIFILPVRGLRRCERRLRSANSNRISRRLNGR